MSFPPNSKQGKAAIFLCRQSGNTLELITADSKRTTQTKASLCPDNYTAVTSLELPADVPGALLRPIPGTGRRNACTPEINEQRRPRMCDDLS